MNLWRVQLKSPLADPSLDLAEYCVGKGMIGVGWRVDTIPSSSEHYLALRKMQNGGKASKGVSAFVKRLQKGDLIWVRSRKHCYYLGKLTGDWEYRTDYPEADAFNVRRCDWVRVGLLDGVPGAVINNFRQPRTVLRVKDASALRYSQYLYASQRGEPFNLTGSQADVLQLLSDEDLEDVAAAYPQVVMKAIMIPSSCKRDTARIECLFSVPEDGERIGLQVKSGMTPINRDCYADSDCKVYLFQANGQYHGRPNLRCEYLLADELRTFVSEHRKLMPQRVIKWLEFAERNDDPDKAK